MTHDNRIKRKYAAGEPVSWVLLDILSLQLVEMLGALGCDCIMIEGEHAAYDESLIAQICQVARISGMTPVIRLRTIHYDQIGRLLDIGILGIHATHVRSKAEAEHLVSCARYPPHGDRGWGRFAAVNGYGLADERAAIAAGDAAVLLSVCIEDVQGAACVAEICGVNGIDAVSIGGSDLSASMGKPGEYSDPRYVATVKQIEAAIAASPLAGRRLFHPEAPRCVCAAASHLIAGAFRSALSTSGTAA